MQIHHSVPSCDTNVNYTEHILRDVLTHGLADSKIRLDLLRDKNQDMALEKVLQFVEAKESGRQSACHLHQAQGADAACSQYQSAKNTELKNHKPNNPNSDPCHHCGKRGHGRNSPTRVRKLECPAYRKHCDHCGRANHFTAVCQAKLQRPTLPNATTAEAEGAVFDALCTFNNSGFLLEKNLGGQKMIDHRFFQNNRLLFLLFFENFRRGKRLLGGQKSFWGCLL